MNTNELVAKLADAARLTKAHATRAPDAAFNAIKGNVFIWARNPIYPAVLVLVLALGISVTTRAESLVSQACRDIAANFADTPDAVEASELSLLGRCVVTELQRRSDIAESRVSSVPNWTYGSTEDTTFSGWPEGLVVLSPAPQTPGGYIIMPAWGMRAPPSGSISETPTVPENALEPSGSVESPPPTP